MAKFCSPTSNRSADVKPDFCAFLLSALAAAGFWCSESLLTVRGENINQTLKKLKIKKKGAGFELCGQKCVLLSPVFMGACTHYIFGIK